MAALVIVLSCLLRPAMAQPGPVELPFGVGLEVSSGAVARRGDALEAMIDGDDRIERLVAPVAGLAEDRQLAYVQAVVGQMIAWRADLDLDGVDDRWATPRQTLARRAGDCEDIAILKLAALSNLGFPRDRLALVVGRESERGEHAIAAAFSSGSWHLLDEGEAVRRPASYPDFAAIYVLTSGRAYLMGHLREIRTAMR